MILQNAPERANSRIDKDRVKAEAEGHWPQIITSIHEIDPSASGQPCPQCGGTDRFFLFPDFAQSGGVGCRKCGEFGDGLATIRFLTGKSFPDALRWLNEWLRIDDSSNSSKFSASSNAASKPRKHKPRVDPEFANHLKVVPFFRDKIQVWADERKVSLESLEALAPRCNAAGDITFPERSADGTVTGTQTRRLRPSSSNRKWYFSGERGAQFTDQLLRTIGEPRAMIVVCEGFADVASCLEAELDVIGRHTAKADLTKLAPLLQKSQVDTKIVVIAENDHDLDGSKRKGVIACAEKLAVAIDRQVYLASPPEEHNDLSDHWRALKSQPEVDSETAAKEFATWYAENLEELRSLPSEVTNYELEFTVDENGAEVRTKSPLSPKEIADRVLRKCDGWPKRIGSELFVCEEGRSSYLTKPPHLFSWLREKGTVDWANGAKLLTKEEFFIAMQRSVEEFTSIQSLPHFPSIKGAYYSCPQPDPGDGSHLQKLVSFFSPATEVDQQLILAGFVTPFWGGPPGQRPSFMISAAEGAGQGSGKTTYAAMVGRLSGGTIDVSAGTDSEELKRRFLSGSDCDRRTVLLDNLKKTSFSDAGIEGILTATEISGHRMFVGAASRPNLFTWFFTMNGPMLSRDLAQRCLSIVLARPEHSGAWLEQVTQFIDTNRESLVADIAGFYARKPAELASSSRWGLWERDVLARLEDPSRVAEVIRARQATLDVDQQQANAIEEFMNIQLKRHGYEHPMRVHVPNRIAARWVQEALDDESPATTRQITAMLKRYENSGAMKTLKQNPSRTNGRGWIFSSDNVDAAIDYGLEERIRDVA
ncbi:MAG: hypothetical protein Aurels2KO_54500 [Aureliella sp.]